MKIIDDDDDGQGQSGLALCVKSIVKGMGRWSMVGSTVWEKCCAHQRRT
jgi:hypothetical protein